MSEVHGARLQHARVGVSKILRSAEATPYGFTVEDEWVADELDRKAMGLTPGRSYKRVRFPGYPIRVTEDTVFKGCSFDQAKPHTDGVFEVAAGVKVRFEDCNGVNLSAPDGAAVVGGAWHHGAEVPTGNPEHPGVFLLCECEKCATALGEMQDCHAGLDEWEKDAEGRVVHSDGNGGGMKERFRARRDFEMLVEADVATTKDLNAAALEAWRI